MFKIPGLAGSHQALNAALAAYLCASWIQTMMSTSALSFESSSIPPGVDTLSSSNLPPAFLDGLAKTTWVGRAQIYKAKDLDPNVTWYLDGAHTPESILVCSEWFESVLKADGDASPRYVGFLR